MAYAHRPDGTGIWFETFGAPDGEPILLIQGLGASSLGWVRQRRALARRYRCIALDNRGAGRSDKPAGPYDLAEMAEDAVAVLDAAGVERAHLIGASMGGVIAQLIAVLHPDRVAALVLTCTACRHHGWRRELLAEWRTTALEHGMRSLAGRSLRWLVGPRLRRRLELPAAVLWPLIAAAPADAFAAQVDAILNADDGLRLELRKIEAPTLVVTGSQDILTPVGDAEELAELIPDAQLAVIHGAAHAVMIDHASAYNRAVLDFLAAHPVAAKAGTNGPKGGSEPVASVPPGPPWPERESQAGAGTLLTSSSPKARSASTATPPPSESSAACASVT